METTYHAETPPAVRKALDRALEHRDRIRVFYGNTKTGAAWPEEYDVTGRVGRSTGTVKVPLLLSRRSSYGGPSMLDHCIVGIKGPRGWIYRHENFSVGEFKIHWDALPEVRVSHNGETFATFKTIAQAWRRVAFMLGARLGK